MTLRSGPGLGLTKVSRGLHVGYDNDGDIEMLVTNLNATPDLIRRSRKCQIIRFWSGPLGAAATGRHRAEVNVASGFTQWSAAAEAISRPATCASIWIRKGFNGRPAGVLAQRRFDVISSPPVDHLLVVKEGRG